MAENSAESVEESDFVSYSSPLRRIFDHHIFSQESFLNLSKNYLIIVPIITALLIVILKISIVLVMTNKITVTNQYTDDWAQYKESLLVGNSLSVIPSLLLWTFLMYAGLRILGGKGQFMRSVSIYLMCQIPVIVGQVIILILAFTQPHILAEPEIIQEGAFIYINYAQIFAAEFPSFSIVDQIITTLASLYSFLMAGIGLSVEHKAPKLIGWTIGILGFIAFALFYLLS